MNSSVKSLATLSFCLAVSAVAVSSAADKPTKNLILHSPKDGDGPAVELIDGELLLRSAISDSPDPAATSYKSVSPIFDVRRTDGGTLLVLRPKWAGLQQTAANLDLDGFYLTADYSKSSPTLRFTKEPERGSLWEVPGELKAAPIANKAQKNGKKVYLAVGREVISLKNRFVVGHFEFHPIILSFDSNDTFGVRKIDPEDDGK